jgi:ubiquitin C-terminal hydrolase
MVSSRNTSQTLDMESYAADDGHWITERPARLIYTPKAVIRHCSLLADAGHYVTYRRTGDTWRCYDDTSVSDVADSLRGTEGDRR